VRKHLTLIGLFLFTTTTFAQHGAPGRGAAAIGHESGRFASRVPASARFRSNGIGLRPGFGSYFSTPYYPFIGDYDDNLAPNAYQAPDSLIAAQPDVATPAPPPLAYTPTAHAVVNEYKWNSDDVRAGSDRETFTIVLKDGSKRYPVASWVQNGKLHFVDSQGKQDVLSPEQIDRDNTDRLNSEKNLHMQLPPG
jgi:hypothetical protein